MINYAPRAGSTPARVIEHLRGLAPGAELATAVLADALDLDAACVPSCLEYAVRNGSLAREKRGTRIYWKLGDGVPLAPDDDDPPRRAIVKSSSAALPDVPRWPGLDTHSSPPEKQIPPPKGAKAAHAPTASCGRDDATPNDGAVPQGSEFRCALWSDGRLHIEPYPGNFMLLTKDEARQLVHYLERMGESAT